MFLPIPGWLISALTFPGIMLHEFAHSLGCKLGGLKVYEVVYFNLNFDSKKPAGWVRHEEPKTLLSGALSSFFPLLVNLFFCFVFGLIYGFFNGNSNSVFIILAWIGISFGMHAAPSPHDAENFKQLTKKLNSNILAKFFATLISWIFALWYFASMFWLNYLAAFVIFWAGANFI